jgi:sucrose-6-phosphate hydrolase SacC (GH32 family)
MSFENMPTSDPRRIQMAWMRGWDDYPKNMPFNQQASFPCELSLRKSGDQLILCRQPVREISMIHGTTLSRSDLVLKPGDNPLAGIKGELFDIRLRLDVSRSQCDKVVLATHGNVTEYDLRQAKLRSHGTEIPLAPVAGEIEIRVLVDRLSLETFGNRGEVSITNIAYQNRDRASLELHAEGGEAVLKSLEVKELRSIWK